MSLLWLWPYTWMSGGRSSDRLPVLPSLSHINVSKASPLPVCLSNARTTVSFNNSYIARSRDRSSDDCDKAVLVLGVERAARPEKFWCPARSPPVQSCGDRRVLAAFLQLHRSTAARTSGSSAAGGTCRRSTVRWSSRRICAPPFGVQDNRVSVSI